MYSRFVKKITSGVSLGSIGTSLFITAERSDPISVVGLATSRGTSAIHRGVNEYAELDLLFSPLGGTMAYWHPEFSLFDGTDYVGQSVVELYPDPAAFGNVTLQFCTRCRFIVPSNAVGPFFASTKCAGADAPFTVVFHAKPLFLEQIPPLVFFKKKVENVTLPDPWIVPDVSNPYASIAIRQAVHYNVMLEIEYVVDAANVGKVVEVVEEKTGSVEKYTLAGRIKVGIPVGGHTEKRIVGRQNPADFTKRGYVPRVGSYDELGYVPMDPVLLNVEDLDETKASGRMVYEHSRLLLNEPRCTKYVVSVLCLEGAGVVGMGHLDNESVELSEYEC